MSNTPETEKVKAALHTNWYDLLNHARKLERERDEAREALASREVVIAQQNVITDLLLERDEARDAIVGWENKWKYAIDMAARAELERDDAQEDAKLLSERLTALELESTAELARLEQELINMKELYESNN
jgi:hypothetical protein